MRGLLIICVALKFLEQFPIVQMFSTRSSAASNRDTNKVIVDECIINFLKPEKKLKPNTDPEEIDLEESSSQPFFTKYDSESDFVQSCYSLMICGMLYEIPANKVCLSMQQNNKPAQTSFSRFGRCGADSKGLDRSKAPQNREVSVQDVVPFRCTLESYRMDLSLLSPDESFLLGVLEFKNGGINNLDQHLRQLICCMLCPLAYGVWGILGDNSPLVGLLIYPTEVHLVSLKRPSNPQRFPFGLEMTIKSANTIDAMKGLVREHMQATSALYVKALSVDIEACRMSPRTWFPMNMGFEDGVGGGLIQKAGTRPHNGFLFRTRMAVAATQLTSIPEVSDLEVPNNDNIIIKYLSTLLDIDCHRRPGNIWSILVAEMKTSISQQAKQLKLRAAGRSRKKVALPSREEELGSLRTRIKHPYLGIAKFLNHNLLFMKDMRQDLEQWVETAGFHGQWGDASVREAFFEDVGMTALNLVEKFSLSHNDIRLANIAFHEGRFCLLDFDFADSSLEHIQYCPIAKGLNNSLTSRQEFQFMFSLAQMTLVVYQLDRCAQGTFNLETARGMRRNWLQECALEQQACPPDFQDWAAERDVQDVFSTGMGRSDWGRGEFEAQLRRMLQLPAVDQAPWLYTPIPDIMAILWIVWLKPRTSFKSSFLAAPRQL